MIHHLVLLGLHGQYLLAPEVLASAGVLLPEAVASLGAFQGVQTRLGSA